MGIFDRKKPAPVKRNYSPRKSPASEKAAPVSNLESLIKTTTIGFSVSNFDYDKAQSELSRISQYNPWVSASIRAIVRNSITPILKFYAPDNTDVEAPELSALLQKPHPLFNWSKWLKFNIFYNIHSGVAYNYIIRNEQGKPIALQPIPPDYVTLDNASLASGALRYIIHLSGENRTVDASDMMIWQDYEYITGYYTGTSRLKHLLFSIHNKNAADLYNKGSFENGGLVKGILSTEQKLNPTDAKQIKEQWKSSNGAENGSGIGVIGQGTKYVSTGQTNAEMGFEALQRVSQQEVNAVFHVPSIEMGLDTANYATAKEQRKLFWETMMIPLMDSFAEVLTEFYQKEYNTPNKAYYDYSNIAVMQNDLNTKLQSAQIMQFLGYDNTTITTTLDLPELPEQSVIIPTTQTPAPAPESTPVKSFNIKNDAIYRAYRDQMKSTFLTQHSLAESKYMRYLKQYFFSQRNQILDFFKSEYKIKAAAPDVNPADAFDQFWGDQLPFWNKELIDATGKYFAMVDSTTVKNMIQKYGLQYYSGVKSTLKINNHMQKIVQINETTNTQTYQAILDEYNNGIKNGLSSADIAANIVESVRNVFLVGEKRAMLISRTETTAVANDLFLTNFSENGITEKEWLTSQDESVRAISDGAEFDHTMMDGQTTLINEMFIVPGKTVNNPVQHPGDMVHGEAGNVCNCRCTMLPK